MKTYQTIILQAIMKHLEAGNEDITVTLRDIGGHLTKTAIGLSVFCTRLVDKLWTGYYCKPCDALYSFLKNLVEQGIARPKLLPLTELQNALNRVVLYQLSTVPENEPEQKELVETLCLLSSHSHVIFDETNHQELFYQCLLYRLLQLVFTEHTPIEIALESGRQSPTYPSSLSSDSEQPSSNEKSKASRHFKGYVPIMSSSLLKSGANRLWSKMLEHKREILESILSMPLPVPASRSTLAPPLTSQSPTTLPSTTGDLGASLQVI